MILKCRNVKRRPVEIIIPILEKPIRFDSTADCSRFLGLHNGDISKALKNGYRVRGMKIQDTQSNGFNHDT